MVTRFVVVALAAVSLASGVAAQQADPSALAAQKAALDKLAMLDGQWRGTATVTQGGRSFTMTETERVGPMLGGTIRVVEGRGTLPNAAVAFNAFAVISYDAQTGYVMRSYAQGHAGDFPVTVTPDGFAWTLPAGPGTMMRYTATIKEGAWHEVGQRIVGSQPPVTFIELDLKRVGDTDWPAAGAVPAR